MSITIILFVASSGIVALPMLNIVSRCGTTEKVAVELPGSFDFLPLLFIPFRSGASLLLCAELMWELGGI